LFLLLCPNANNPQWEWHLVQLPGSEIQKLTQKVFYRTKSEVLWRRSWGLKSRSYIYQLQKRKVDKLPWKPVFTNFFM
jgi:hypothetical protein